MPEPRTGESREDFLDRCIPEVVAEGRDPDQAVAMCLAYYEGEKDKAFNLDKMGEVEYWKAFERKRQSFESKYTRRIIKAINDQLEIYRDASTIADFRKPIDPEIMKEVYTELYMQVGDSFARSTFSGLKSMPYTETKEEPAWIAQLQKLIDYDLRDRLRGLNETTRKKVDDIVQKALENGENTQQIKERIMGVRGLGSLNGTTPARAETISNTEIVTASNAGSLIGAISTGLNFDKQWLTTLDGGARDSHKDANQQRVGKSEPFRVGGADLQFPGDPNAPAEEVINCRCTQIYITED
jgi:hypothetical protein